MHQNKTVRGFHPLFLRSLPTTTTTANRSIMPLPSHVDVDDVDMAEAKGGRSKSRRAKGLMEGKRRGSYKKFHALEALEEGQHPDTEIMARTSQKNRDEPAPSRCARPPTPTCQLYRVLRPCSRDAGRGAGLATLLVCFVARRTGGRKRGRSASNRVPTRRRRHEGGASRVRGAASSRRSRSTSHCTRRPPPAVRCPSGSLRARRAVLRCPKCPPSPRSWCSRSRPAAAARSRWCSDQREIQAGVCVLSPSSLPSSLRVLSPSSRHEVLG